MKLRKRIFVFLLGLSILSLLTQLHMLLQKSENINLGPDDIIGMLDLPGIHTYLPHLKGKRDFLKPAFNISKNRTGGNFLSPLFKSNNLVPDDAADISDVSGIHTYLPHLKGKRGFLKPAFNVSKNRTGVKLVIGVPTIRRPLISYLPSTLQSLFTNLRPDEEDQCLIIVFLAEPWNMSYAKDEASTLSKRFASQVQTGLLEVLVPNPEFYPNLDSLPLTMNDTKERVRWRTKQNLDYTFLMFYASSKGHYYLQLEDDVITKPRFFAFIMQTLSRRGDNWFVLKFSSLGFIGKLFHASDLPFLCEFLLMFHAVKPGDWLLDNLLTTKVCGKDMVIKECTRRVGKVAIDIRPALFQHIGYHSSLKGKIQKLKEKVFSARTHGIQTPLAKLNPQLLTAHSTISAYKKYSLLDAYTGVNYFWGVDPMKDDIIDFIYDPPINITAYNLISGDSNHQKDIFPPSTTVEVLSGKVTRDNKGNLIPEMNEYKVVGTFDTFGMAVGSIDPSLNPLSVIRIHINANMSSWIILSKILFT